ncbi:MAG: glutathione S-transferase [Massilia sp.]
MPNNAPSQPIRLHSFALSGHAHRVRLFLSLLNLPHEVIEVDLRASEHKTPAFLAKNPIGQVPVIEDGEVTLADSNAILVYLAGKYGDAAWLPRDPLGAARVQRYLSLAAGELARGPAAARMIKLFGAPFDEALARATTARVFGVLEGELAGKPFLDGEAPTIADVACYTYIAHAPEGGISLADYPRLRAWLTRIEALPRFVPMAASPLPA